MRLLVAGGLLAAAAAFAVPGSAQVLGQDAGICEAGHGPAINVDVRGLKDRAGELWLELYPATQADFLGNDDALIAAGKTFRRTRATLPASGAVDICVKVPHPGRYALLLRHNRTGKDKFSIWRDGLGIADNQAIGRHKPSVEQATVTAGGGVTTIPIKVQYLHGFGFSPLS